MKQVLPPRSGLVPVAQRIKEVLPQISRRQALTILERASAAEAIAEPISQLCNRLAQNTLSLNQLLDAIDGAASAGVIHQSGISDSGDGGVEWPDKFGFLALLFSFCWACNCMY